MAQRKTERLTPLELEIMKVLWETGAAALGSGVFVTDVTQ